MLKQLRYGKNRGCKYHHICLLNGFFRCIAYLSDRSYFPRLVSSIWVAVITTYVLCYTCLVQCQSQRTTDQSQTQHSYFFHCITSIFSINAKSKQKSRGSIPLLPPVYLQTWSFLRNSTGPRLDRRAKIKVPCKNFIKLGSKIGIHNGWIVHAISSCCQELM